VYDGKHAITKIRENIPESFCRARALYNSRKYSNVIATGVLFFLSVFAGENKEIMIIREILFQAEKSLRDLCTPDNRALFGTIEVLAKYSSVRRSWVGITSLPTGFTLKAREVSDQGSR
jgi:hypothetical protein